MNGIQPRAKAFLLALFLSPLVGGDTAAAAQAAAPAAQDGAHPGDSQQSGDSSSIETVLRDRAGGIVGRATLVETPHGVLVRVAFDRLPPGTHAFHVHETGRCEPPFESAGGHFNPTGRHHGYESENGYHSGDLPNLHVPDDGRATVEFLARDLSLRKGPSSLLDGDGSALVVHAGADDYKTDPAGAAGERVACGALEAR